ncbi:MAG TPA: hypothetical protein GYA07_00555 [Verrucomicrobia bacterium]|nr:hypothetical protein [Verrucomicrobiota bacterium]HOB32494.1 hypothetical protein [Verrucomicrobiota bacterium]HOP98137.1 hypothetical protein [Verrucomicrobiota bacterium]HPU56584.1 hypothetical protein [Verrucomicrobiota bacterium]
MFFFEWLLPLFVLLAVGVLVLFLAVRRLPDAGVRTDGRTVVDQQNETESSDAA